MHNARLLVFVLLMTIFFNPVYAQELQRMGIDFDILADSSVLQTTKFFFNAPLAGDSVNYTLNDAVREIEVSDETQKLEHQLIRQDGYVLQIFLKAPTKSLTINYVTDKIIFRSDNVNHFFTEFSFERAISVSARLKLPEGFGLYQDSYRPADASIVSDGKRIILLWDLPNVQSVFFSVKFVKLEEGGLFVAVAALAGLAIFLFLYFRHKTREEFLKGFREDEKKVIEYLRERRLALQSDLQKEFHFSRAKATRIVMHLEQKGLVRKQRYGRTNKLFWLK